MKRMRVCRGRGGGEGRVKKEEERDDNRERDSWIKRERELDQKQYKCLSK